MKEYVFEKSVLISNAEIDDLWLFHADTNNLPVISPPFPFVKLLEISDIPLKKGSRIKLRVNFIIFSSVWEIEIADAQRPDFVTDNQLKGIFRKFYHVHKFEKTAEGVLMTDHITYSPPFPFLPGLQNIFAKIQLNQMFSLRHKKTKEYFERKIK